MLQSVEADLDSLADGLGDHLSGLLNLVPEERWTSESARDSQWSSSGASRSPVVPEAQSKLVDEEEEQERDEVSGAQNGGTGGTPRPSPGG